MACRRLALVAPPGTRRYSLAANCAGSYGEFKPANHGVPVSRYAGGPGVVALGVSAGVDETSAERCDYRDPLPAHRLTVRQLAAGRVRRYEPDGVRARPAAVGGGTLAAGATNSPGLGGRGCCRVQGRRRWWRKRTARCGRRWQTSDVPR